MSIDSHHPCWHRASSLRERCAVGPCEPAADFDAENADFRLASWRNQPPFADDEFFRRRLAQDGASEDGLRCLLGDSEAALAARFPQPPAWAQGLDFATPGDTPEAGSETPSFSSFFRPWVEAARARLRARLAELEAGVEHRPYAPETLEELLHAPLPRQLGEFASRTLVLEINVARVQGRLQGETAEERQRSFFAGLRSPQAVLELLAEYPVLARQLVNHLEQWQRVNLEFVRHLCTDWPRLQEHFGLDSGARLTVASEAGDRHRKGRAVRVLEFSSGQKVVYKPRHLAVEVHFQELLAWLNGRGDHCPLRPQLILDCGDHGWVEYLGHADCEDEAAVSRFFERQGAYLALFYALKATDFHYGNIIACGEHPMPVDLEALFHANAADRDAEATGAVDYLAGDFLRDSVVRVGLLPQRLWSRQGYAGIDLSGLAARPGQLSPQKALRFEAAGTDEVHVVMDYARLGGGENRARLRGEDVDPLAYTDALLAGFVKVYRTLLAHRQELMAADGPLAPFGQGEVRVIVRATRSYSLLMRECMHPDALRDGLDRDQLLDRLWASVPVRPALERLVAAERADLWRGDIPIFFTRPDSRHLWTSDGEQLDDFFEQPSLELVHQQLEALSEDDLVHQQWFIRASCALLEPVGQGDDGRSWGRLELAQRPGREALLAAADRIGERLRQWSVRGPSQEASWVGVTALKSHQWNLSPLSVDLYSGVPGVALFLAYLGRLTGNAETTALARGALATTRYHVERMQEIQGPIGAFSGWGGPIYLLTHLGVLWDEPELLEKAAALAAKLPEQLAGDVKLDVIGGAAGAIGCLLGLHTVHLDPAVLAAARACGEHLLARAEASPAGLCWRGEDMLGQPLTGFGHGAAGIAWALHRLASACGEERFRTAAEAALAYERSLFVPEVGNWRDLRNPADIAAAEGREESQSEVPAAGGPAETAVRCMHAWCHGAPGIGLGRLDMLATGPQPALEADVRAAIETTRQRGFGRNHSLCHGDLGNLDLLLQASRQLGDSGLEDETYRLAGALLKRIDEHGWVCGVPLEVETPGLMTGIAGIGYQLLRLADPERVPSVLVLGAPRVG